MVGFIRRTLFIGSIGCAIAAVGVAVLRAGVPQTQPATQAARPTPTPTPPFIVTTSPARASSDAEIEKLIGKLSSDLWKERQAAEDRLIGFGPDVSPRLERLARESTDQEVVTRAQGALRMIAENRLLGPTLVTMHVKNAPAQQVFAELARQAHTEIPPEPPELWTQHEWPRVTIDADRVEFWTVFRSACQQAGVVPEQSDNERMHVAEPAATDLFNKDPAITRGAFLLVADGIEVNLKQPFGDRKNMERTATVTMHAMAEPKLRIIRDSAAATLEEAVDDRGNSVLPTQEGTEPSLSTSGDNGRAWDLTLQIQYLAKNRGSSLARFHGKLQFLIPVRTETLVVENILQARNLPRSVAGRRFLFRSARKNGNGYEVKITAYRDGLPDAEWQQMISPHDFIRLTDDKDRPIPFSGISDSDGGDKQITFTLQFESANWQVVAPNAPPNAKAAEWPGKPSKLLWDIPVETRLLVVPFQFDDGAVTVPS